MRYSLILIISMMVSLSHAQAPASVVIDGVEYAPVPKNDQREYTIPASSLGGEENCWYEQVAIPVTTVNESPNIYGAIVGGILGGVIGHQFGSGSGKAAATIGGAALGTALGSTPQSQPQQQRYQTVRKCNTAR